MKHILALPEAVGVLVGTLLTLTRSQSLTRTITPVLTLSMLLVSCPALLAQESPPAGVKFDLETLSKVPETFPAPGFEANESDGVRALFYSGLNYQGQPTRVFAYYGAPKLSADAAASGAKLPAMVLIHGGGGTAFDRWVRLWNSRGYAAIAMDLCGCVPNRVDNKWQRHEHGGPPGWNASFGQLDQPVNDQWTKQAVSAVALAHSLIRSYPEVDPDRIGVTGISWGGYLTCIVAGVDSRFKAAAPVYGCGYLGDNSAWLADFEKLGSEKARLWLQQWDPSGYLPQAKMPMLWVNGTNDFAYPMDSWQKSNLLVKTPTTLCLRIRMPHGHGAAGENPEEIHAFMNSILKGGQPLAKITQLIVIQAVASAKYESATPIVKAELCYTGDTGRWQERKWEAIPALLDAERQSVSATIPDTAKVFYINLFDEAGRVVSTQHTVR